MPRLTHEICYFWALITDHPLQPPIIDCLQSIPADAEGVYEPAGSVSANTTTSSQSNQPQTVESLNFAQTQTQTDCKINQ